MIDWREILEAKFFFTKILLLLLKTVSHKSKKSLIKLIKNKDF